MRKSNTAPPEPELEPWVVEALAAAAEAEAAQSGPAESPAGVLVPFPACRRDPPQTKLSDEPLRHVPRLLSTADQPGSSLVMLACAIEQLVQAIPMRYTLSDWRLLYSTHVHGISINTLFTRCAGVGACVLALRARDGGIFGGFASELKRPSEAGLDRRQFYGSGESFLWQLEAIGGLPPLPTADRQPPDHLLHCHRWTGENHYFMLSNKDHLAMGSGGHFGLWVDSELLHGSSGTSATFANPCLCAPPPPSHPPLADHPSLAGGDRADASGVGAAQGSGGAPAARGAAAGGVRSASDGVGEFVCDVLEVWGMDGHLIKRRGAEMARQGLAP